MFTETPEYRERLPDLRAFTNGEISKEEFDRREQRRNKRNSDRIIRKYQPLPPATERTVRIAFFLYGLVVVCGVLFLVWLFHG